MKGFTLVEVLVVAAITVMISGFMLTNFSRTRVDLNQTTLQVEDAIREAQAEALAGSLFTNPGGPSASTYRCGYGVHFMADGFLIYAGPDSSLVDCSTADRNYNAGADLIVRSAVFSNNVVEVGLPAPDIFFEPPNPTTFIGDSQAAGVSTDIRIRRQNAVCSAASTTDCRLIHVSTSGLIKTQ